MRILIVPLPALAQTNGSQGRVNQLIRGFKKNGFEVATCAALDYNFKKQVDIPNYFLEVPIPMGLPKCIGKNLFQIASSAGVTSRKTVNSFEEVLFLTGGLSERYFTKNIECVRAAIQQYKADIVYSEFNLGSIVAGKLEKIKVITNYSYPVQASYACTLYLAKGVNKVLYKLGLSQVQSALELFDLADYKIIPSSYRLEPIEGKNVIFTGPLLQNIEKRQIRKNKPNKIVAYMGTGTISTKRLVKELREAFYKSEYEVYIVGKGLKESVDENIHMAEYFNFEELLSEAIVMLHHGGQNSIMDALRFGVPQIICPGKVFERRYNVQSINREGVGIIVKEQDFKGSHIKSLIKRIQEDSSYLQNSKQLWDEMSHLGGVDRVIELIQRL